jgi:hypothetical protein
MNPSKARKSTPDTKLMPDMREVITTGVIPQGTGSRYQSEVRDSPLDPATAATNSEVKEDRLWSLGTSPVTPGTVMSLREKRYVTLSASADRCRKAVWSLPTTAKSPSRKENVVSSTNISLKPAMLDEAMSDEGSKLAAAACVDNARMRLVVIGSVWRDQNEPIIPKIL